jgi:exosortase/archaeosortase family protein
MTTATMPWTTSFAVKALALSVAIFGLLRLPSVEQGFVQAFINLQVVIARWYGAPSTPSVIVNPSCSAVDVMSLCLGITLAYPTAWRGRVIGAAGGLLTILVLNTIRIGTLLSVADSAPQRLSLLHEYVWPAILVASILFYIWFWTRIVEGREVSAGPGRTPAMHPRMPRFVAAATGLLAVYALTVPWTMTSTILVAAGAWTAAAARAFATTAGIQATAHGTILSTARGAFEVTPECLLTPILPIYLAAAVVFPDRPRQRWFWLAAAIPLLFGLSVLRLLVLVLPPYLVASPLALAHGFFQLVAAAALIAAACVHPAAFTGVASRRQTHPAIRWVVAAAGGILAGAVAGDALAAVVSVAAGLTLTVAPHALTDLARPGDVQGALESMPAFQLGLLVGLWMALTAGNAWRRLVWTLLALCALQVLWLVVVGEWAAHAGAVPHALVLRAWNVGVPVALALLTFLRRNDGESDGNGYRRFWQQVGREFPDLGGATSTGVYFRNEVRLLTENLPNLDGCRLLKTDLWDEAKNTRILCWAADRGATVYGVDISEPIVRQARASFDGSSARLSLGDVRQLPFAAHSFDAIYSMGTIEHFDESEAAVREMARVLKPGGRLVLGVPNRHDPFLRPLLVWLLSAVGLYAYGFEKSYSRRQLNRILEGAGLVPIGNTGILFMPGWLRMADLAAHAWCRPLTRLTRPAIAGFEWLETRFPSLRRHGYLVVSVASRAGER